MQDGNVLTYMPTARNRADLMEGEGSHEKACEKRAAHRPCEMTDLNEAMILIEVGHARKCLSNVPHIAWYITYKRAKFNTHTHLFARVGF